MRIKRIDPRAWYDVPGYDGEYQVNYYGKARRRTLEGYEEMNPFLRNGQRAVRVRDTERTIMKLMQITFLGDIPPGMTNCHKNGNQLDDELGNIGFTTWQEIGRRSARKNKKQIKVAKINKDGEVVEFYKSIRAPAEKNMLDPKTISERIKGKVKRVFAPDGYVYCMDTDAEISRTIRRIRKAKEA